jgi:hypothetical protein
MCVRMHLQIYDTLIVYQGTCTYLQYAKDLRRNATRGSSPHTPIRWLRRHLCWGFSSSNYGYSSYLSRSSRQNYELFKNYFYKCWTVSPRTDWNSSLRQLQHRFFCVLSNRGIRHLPRVHSPIVRGPVYEHIFLRFPYFASVVSLCFSL